MWSSMQSWWGETFGDEPSTDVRGGHRDSVRSSASVSGTPEVTSTGYFNTNSTTNVSANSEVNANMQALSALPFGMGGLFSMPLQEHQAAMERFNSEQQGKAEKLNAEAMYGAAEREKPLAELKISEEATIAGSEVVLQNAMTGREGSVGEQQIVAHSARRTASAIKQIENKQQASLDAVYNEEYGRILQVETNKIDVPGRFWGFG